MSVNQIISQIFEPPMETEQESTNLQGLLTIALGLSAEDIVGQSYDRQSRAGNLGRPTVTDMFPDLVDPEMRFRFSGMMK